MLSTYISLRKLTNNIHTYKHANRTNKMYYELYPTPITF